MAGRTAYTVTSWVNSQKLDGSTQDDGAAVLATAVMACLPAALEPPMGAPLPLPCSWRRATCCLKIGLTSGYDVSVMKCRPWVSAWISS